MSDGSGGTLPGGACRATKGGAASATPIHRRACANGLGVMTCLQSRHIIVVISRGSTATVPPLGAILFGQNRSRGKKRREAGSPDDAAAACKRGYLAGRADRGRGIFRVVHGHQAARSRAQGLSDHREERRGWRHVVGEPLSRLCLRCSIASVFVLVRTQSRVDAHVRECAGNPRIFEIVRRTLWTCALPSPENALRGSGLERRGERVAGSRGREPANPRTSARFGCRCAACAAIP